MNILSQNWEYIKYFIKHKFMTAVYCYKLGVFWRGITHDLSKLLPDEWVPYVRHFYGEDKHTHKETRSFKRAWLKHVHRNEHHPFHWVTDDGKILDMPDAAIKEMVADWHGAAYAQGKRPQGALYWYFIDNHDKLPLSPRTKEKVEDTLKDLFWYDRRWKE